MARTYRTINRNFAILNQLQLSSRAYSVREIFERLQADHPADERTYRRDLENLEHTGLLSTSQEDGPGDTPVTKYKAQRSFDVGHSLKLDLRELFSLYVAKNMLAPLRETPFYTDLQKIFTKIETVLGPKGQDHLKSLAAEIHFEPGPRWGLGIDPETLDVVEQCCAEGHVLEASYRPAHGGGETTRRFGPHFLYFAKGSLYLVAKDLGDETVKTFALPRMSRAAMTDEVFGDPKLDPETFFASSFGVFRGENVQHVSLKFKPPQAAHVRERRWHPTQRVIPHTDGTVELSLDVSITPELVQWILSFGTAVQVTAPNELAREVVTTAIGVVGLYGVASGRQRMALKPRRQSKKTA